MHSILIVDDEYLSREGMKLIIQEKINQDIKILEAKNGIEARNIVNNNELDIILLDINIPGLNGIDLCRYVKSNFSDIDIIVTTAYDDINIKNKMVDLNVSQYFIKPIRPEKIIRSLKSILNKYKKEKIKYYEEYLIKIKTYIDENCYKESVDTVKSYLHNIYTVNNEKDIKDDIKLFIDGIYNICKSKNLHIYENINNRIEIINKNYFEYFKMNVLSNELINLINDIFDVILTKDNNTNNYVKDILNYIERNINKNITLEDAASYVNLSPHYLSKIFKKEICVNFITYLTDRRIDIAKEMLEDESIPISNIAIELCYSKSNYFSKVFKKKVGITPTQYRDEYLKNKERYATLV